MWYYNNFLTTFAVMPTTSYAVAEEVVPVRGLTDRVYNLWKQGVWGAVPSRCCSLFCLNDPSNYTRNTCMNG